MFFIPLTLNFCNLSCTNKQNSSGLPRKRDQSLLEEEFILMLL